MGRGGGDKSTDGIEGDRGAGDGLVAETAADGLTDRSPLPHQIVVLVRRSGQRRQNTGSLVHPPNSLRTTRGQTDAEPGSTDQFG